MMDQSPGQLRSLILPLWIFSFGVHQGSCLQNPVPELATLHRWIVRVLQTVDVAMLKCVRMELEYCLDILRATRGAHLEVE